MIRCLGLCLSIWILSWTAAAQPRLKVGDPAPKLEIQTWVKGEPVTEFRSGHVYVVEFWATWCPPCKKSIPHLTELQRTHKQTVTIIGISAKDANGETLDKVTKYVQSAGDSMEYTVAFDDGSKTNQAYMVAARQRGIPAAFVVDQHGRIAWIGHPLMGLDDVLTRVVKGEFDPDRAHKGDALAKEIHELIRTQRHDEAMDEIDALIALDPEKFGQYAAVKFQYLLTTKNDRPTAYAYATSVTAGPLKENARAHADIAWAILTDPDAASRKLDMALALANRAAELSERKDASILDTLARAQYETNDVPSAIATQKLAISLAKPVDIKRMGERLATYEQGK